MNYKYLGKYHHIYRLSIGGDLKAHVEKFPIVYSNKSYIYYSVTGDPELHKAILTTGFYEPRNVYDSLDESLMTAIKRQIGANLRTQSCRNFSRYYFFLLDDPAELQTFANNISKNDLIKVHLQGEKERLVRDIKDRENYLNEKRGELQRIQNALEKLEEVPNVAGYQDQWL